MIFAGDFLELFFDFAAEEIHAMRDAFLDGFDGESGDAFEATFEPVEIGP